MISALDNEFTLYIREFPKLSDDFDMLSSPFTNDFQNKLTNWNELATRGSVETFSSIFERRYQDILPLILNWLDTLLTVLSKYCSSISVVKYDLVRNPFVGLETFEGQFTLAEKEELSIVESDRTLMLKYSS
ncbi:hypothetical protein RF11_07271 [Thelohanellus kitauei]|uniref:Uncharacterized protein n=1 Tax=Thelohanellus kitauei TaxID=669202 RepID=A0A0C2IWG4_THEKT|nr:hypothetical protein RF11_07271 [Thelohanellus kitauei]